MDRMEKDFDEMKTRVSSVEHVVGELERRASRLLDEYDAENTDKHEVTQALKIGITVLMLSGIFSGLVLPLILKLAFHI